MNSMGGADRCNMISDNVRRVFRENLWFVATCGDGPNVVPVGFKCVLEDGRLAIGAMLLETTLENIRQNGQVAVAVANPLTAEAYQIKGTAALATDGPAYEHYAKLAEETYHGEHPVKCAVIITPEKLIVASPNEHNREEIPLDERSVTMNEKEVILEAMRKAGTPLNAGKVAELTGLDRKVVDKVFAELKKEGAIVSPVRCKWEPAVK